MRAFIHNKRKRCHAPVSKHTSCVCTTLFNKKPSIPTPTVSLTCPRHCCALKPPGVELVLLLPVPECHVVDISPKNRVKLGHGTGGRRDALLMATCHGRKIFRLNVYRSQSFSGLCLDIWKLFVKLLSEE